LPIKSCEKGTKKFLDLFGSRLPKLGFDHH